MRCKFTLLRRCSIQVPSEKVWSLEGNHVALALGRKVTGPAQKGKKALNKATRVINALQPCLQVPSGFACSALECRGKEKFQVDIN